MAEGPEKKDLDTSYMAVQFGDVPTVKRGLEAGVDVNAKRHWGRLEDCTSLHRASEFGQTEVAELLIQHGTVPAVKMADWAMVMIKPADVEARDQHQSTPLHKAAAGGHTGTCELLIRSGAEITARDAAGKTPLDRARDQETRRFIKNFDRQLKQEKSYHELLQTSGGVRVDRFKVFVGGKEGTGKSTLKRSLKTGPYFALLRSLSISSDDEPHDRSPGVDIETFHVPGVGEVSVWDFAGQAEYAVTHSMFMDAENTVFIVLYNITDDRETQEQEVHWWLCFIKSGNPNRQPDVILVASHADQVALAKGRRQATRVVQTMKAEFKDHLRIADEVILMDCRKTGTPEMDRLKSILVRVREALLQNQRDMPRLCAEIIKRLSEWRKKTSPKFPVMMWRDYVEEVRK